MNRYYFTIEQHNINTKYVHFLGNIYDVEQDYELAEWSNVFISINCLQDMLAKNELFDFLDERYKYIGTVPAEEIHSFSYFDKPCVECPDLCTITQNTPCGNYYFDLE